MFIRVTNALTGKMVTINPSMVGSVQDRDDPKYPKTKSALIMADTRNTFIPCAETEEEISRLLSGAMGGMAGKNAPSVVRQPEPAGTPEER